jgi:diamine N-acetyltransferase
MDKTNVIIRHADSSDANLLAELGARTFEDTFAADNTREDMAAYLASAFTPEQLTVELAHPASIFLIAEVDGVAAGYAKLHAGEAATGVADDKSIELVRLYVSREWLGRGVGEALMRACLNYADSAEHKSIWLGVWERNERALRFYRKWDFQAVGERGFQLGSDLQRDIVMERPIVKAS